LHKSNSGTFLHKSDGETTGVLIRDAALGDAPAMGQLHVAAWRAAYAGSMGAAFLASLDPLEREALWRDQICAGAHVLVALESGLVRGFACFGAEHADAPAPRVGELYAINLHPDAWRRGIGARLLAAVVARLRDAGFREAVLWVVRENARARAFYERFGWRGDGAEKDDGGVTGPLVHELRYRRAL
jgi:ribosomal protein S18 acetylase RimI-like enzyme